MTFFVMADGSVLSASDLERELRAIPGEIVLLVDCCGSGGLIGEAGSAEDLLDGVASVFQGTVGPASFRGSKYLVVASALLDQDSYRIGFAEDGEDMATVFARALCDAAGWSIDRGAQSAMNADADYDGRITLDELGSYMARRVSVVSGARGRVRPDRARLSRGRRRRGLCADGRFAIARSPRGRFAREASPRSGLDFSARFNTPRLQAPEKARILSYISEKWEFIRRRCGMASGKHLLGKAGGRHVFGTVKVGDKGQIVIPKEARVRFGIQPGDALLVLGDDRHGLVVTRPDVIREVAEQVFDGLDESSE